MNEKALRGLVEGMYAASKDSSACHHCGQGPMRVKMKLAADQLAAVLAGGEGEDEALREHALAWQERAGYWRDRTDERLRELQEMQSQLGAHERALVEAGRAVVGWLGACKETTALARALAAYPSEKEGE